MLPLVILAVAINIVHLTFRVAEDGFATSGVAFAVLIVGLAAWMWWVPRRVRRTPGGLWCSKSLAYLGPSDETAGLVGAESFISEHSPKGVDRASPVILVLTAEAMMIVPHTGKQRLLCPLEAVTTIEIVKGARTERGMSLMTRDGRRASFIGNIDDGLATHLVELGATLYRG